MRDTVSIQAAQREDLKDLADLAARAFRDTFLADNDPKDIDEYLQSALSFEQLLGEFDDVSNLFYVARAPGKSGLLGYAKLCTASQHASVGDEKTIEIERLYADKNAIGKGIGAMLMQASLDVAAKLQCSAIWLGVWEQNARAIRFYEGWGFEVTGARSFRLGSDLQKDLVMALSLRQEK